jgi:hypothetical protein
LGFRGFFYRGGGCGQVRTGRAGRPQALCLWAGTCPAPAEARPPGCLAVGDGCGKGAYPCTGPAGLRAYGRAGHVLAGADPATPKGQGTACPGWRLACAAMWLGRVGGAWVPGGLRTCGHRRALAALAFPCPQGQWSWRRDPLPAAMPSPCPTPARGGGGPGRPEGHVGARMLPRHLSQVLPTRTRPGPAAWSAGQRLP